MLKKFLIAAAMSAAMLSTPATAREVMINVPIICDHRETILNDAERQLGITELVFLGDVVGDAGMHYELWTDKEGEAWVAIMVETNTIPDGAGSLVAVTIGCVMGTGGNHKVALPARGDPA